MKKLPLFAMAALMMVACQKNDPKDPNDEPEQKDSAAVYVSQLDLMAQNMSENHKWVVGQTTEYNGFLWNVETGEVVETGVYGGFYAVTNNGIAVGSKGTPDAHAFRYENGNYTTLSVPEGSSGSAAWDITDDGSLMVGFYYDAAYQTKPCVWSADGQMTELPVPTQEEVGFELAGAAVRWVSGDGSVILGYLFDNFSTWPAAVWNKQADGSYVCDPICKDYFEDDYQKGKQYMTFGAGTATMSLSRNGEWISLIVQDEYDPFNWDAEPAPYKGARMNLQTKKLEIAEDVPCFTRVANDGTMVGYDGESPSQRTAYIWKAGAAAPDMLSVDLTGKGYESVVSVSPMAISTDKKAVCGFAVSSADELFSFVVTE